MSSLKSSMFKAIVSSEQSSSIVLYSILLLFLIT